MNHTTGLRFRWLAIAATQIAISVGVSSAQTSPRDFGPPLAYIPNTQVVTIQQFARPVVLAPNTYTAYSGTVAYAVVEDNYLPSPPAVVTQTAFYAPSVNNMATPVGYTAPVAPVISPQPIVASVAVPYTVSYAPAPAASTIPTWSSTTPALYGGETVFGTPTIYGKDQPVRNLVRFIVP